MGSSSCVAPTWVSVLIRTVSPERIRTTGSLSIGYHPQLTFSGVDGTKWSAWIAWSTRSRASDPAEHAANVISNAKVLDFIRLS